jgi:hypothetical protein
MARSKDMVNQMIAETGTSSGPITRGQWIEAVARNSARAIRPHHRRKHNRFFPPMGTAKLVFTMPGGAKTLPVVLTAPILDISDGGLAVKTESMIIQKTGVGLDVNLEGRQMFLMGSVARCTSTIGGYEIGIELVFPRADAAGKPNT